MMPDKKDREWQRFLPARGSTAIAPLLICPDDLDYSCDVLVIEVVAETQFIHWNRVGWDHSLNGNEVGTAVRRLSGIGPFTFCRTEYERCLEDFGPEFYGGEPYWQETGIDAKVYKSKAHLGWDEVKAVEDAQDLGTIPANHLEVGLPLSEPTNSILEVSSSPSISARAVAQWRATLLDGYQSGLSGFVPTKVEKVTS